MNKLKDEDQIDLRPLLERYEAAKNRRQSWEPHWQECYEYALPQRSNISQFGGLGAKRLNTLYDGTALDAVDQLAASLLANLTPPWAQWFGFKAGPDLSDEEAQSLSPILEDIAKKIQSHLDRSNFSVEMHQCFLDLAVGGTATMYFEETEPGAFSAFKFSAVPLQDIVLEEGDDGFLNGSYRELSLTLSQIQKRYGDVELPINILRDGDKDPQMTFDVLESVLPDNGVHQYKAILQHEGNPTLLKTGQFNRSPAISFRWMKSPGEIYGRSPVMKALPDIKTVNKVVELILKNASIAVTGIWQADDDGVLNPANIELVPGAIIPKAVGSKGLTPLEMPGRFDVSELILNDLRSRIRHALMVDKLGPVVDKRMSATEVLERSNEMAMLLGATYGRLQTELITPLIQRAFSILRRRGEIPDIALDGRYITLDYRSPLAKAQGQRDVQNILTWLESVSSLGAEASTFVDVPKTVEMLAESLSIPQSLIRKNISALDAVSGNIGESE
jgi:hypothetical protein